MTSPKITFRRLGKVAKRYRDVAWLLGNTRNSSLPAELNELLQDLVCMHYIPFDIPSLKDIRATLRALAGVSDQEARAAARALDGFTQAQLATAAWCAFLRDRGFYAEITYHDMNVEAWSPERIREMARRVLEQLPTSAGGRPANYADEHFMCALLKVWTFVRTSKTVSREQHQLAAWLERKYGSSFASFARAMFAGVGRNLKDTQLRALRAAAAKRLAG